MISDILLLAEPHFQIVTVNDGKDMFAPLPDDDDNRSSSGAKQLPISRAMTDPRTYLELTDTVLDKIMNTDKPQLRPARILIKRFRSHEIYKRIRVPQNVIGDTVWEQTLWSMKEEEIVEEILKLNEMDVFGDDDDDKALKEDDIIIEKRKIHHGMKEKNPVNFMRFLPKDLHRQLLNTPENLPTARQIPDTSYRKPNVFLQKSVRVYCRSMDKAKHTRLGKSYKEFIDRLQQQQQGQGLENNEQKYSEVFEYQDLPQTPTRDSDCIPTVSQSPIRYDDISPPISKRQKHNSPRPLFAEVRKRSGYR